MELSKKVCKPCEGVGDLLGMEKISELLIQLNSWELVDGKLQKKFRFRDFREGMEFANSVAKIAEEENHHPDILIRYGSVSLTLFTHFLKGLTENDFIVAAKIDELSNLSKL